MYETKIDKSPSYEDMKKRITALEAEVLSLRQDSFYALTAIADNAMEGVAIVQEGIIKYANRALGSVCGFSPAELIGRPFIDIFSPESREPAAKMCCAHQKEHVSADELKILRKDGTKADTEISANIINYRGNPATLGIFRDISARRMAEDALRHSEEKYRVLFTGMPIGLFWSRVDNGKLFECNEHFARILGYNNREECLADFNIAKQYADISIREKFISTLREKGEANDFEAQFIRKDGIKIWVRYSARLDPEKTMIEGGGQDITARKSVEKLVEIQNILSIALSTASGIKDVLTLVLDIITSLDEISMGGIYSCSPDSGEIKLEYTKNLSPEFIESVSNIEKGSPREKTILGGKPAYFNYQAMGLPPDDERVRQGLKSTAAIPILHRGKVLACINIASRTHAEIPIPIRNFLESISSQIGEVIARLLAEEQIKKSLSEKDVLLREIHHRVKNNMQIINSLLNLQAAFVKNSDYAGILRESQDRIKSMSLVHENLYRSKDLAYIDFKEYINTLTASLFRSYGAESGRISLETDIDNVSLNIDIAIPCGLIINELISNSLKYAFPDRKDGKVKIAARSLNGDEIQLEISDNGIGIPVDLDLGKSKTLGLHLVTMLVEDQLHGEIELDRSSGTKFIIRLAKKSESARI